MAKGYFDEWKGGDGRYYCAAVGDSAKTPRGKWWYPARKLNLSLVDYIKLIEQYGGKNIKYYPAEEDHGDVLVFSFDKEAECHKFVLYINRMARNGGW